MERNPNDPVYTNKWLRMDQFASTNPFADNEQLSMNQGPNYNTPSQFSAPISSLGQQRPPFAYGSPNGAYNQATQPIPLPNQVTKLPLPPNHAVHPMNQGYNVSPITNFNTMPLSATPITNNSEPWWKQVPLTTPLASNNMIPTSFTSNNVAPQSLPTNLPGGPQNTPPVPDQNPFESNGSITPNTNLSWGNKEQTFLNQGAFSPPAHFSNNGGFGQLPEFMASSPSNGPSWWKQSPSKNPPPLSTNPVFTNQVAPQPLPTNHFNLFGRPPNFFSGNNESLSSSSNPVQATPNEASGKNEQNRFERTSELPPTRLDEEPWWLNRLPPVVYFAPMIADESGNKMHDNKWHEELKKTSGDSNIVDVVDSFMTIFKTIDLPADVIMTHIRRFNRGFSENKVTRSLLNEITDDDIDKRMLWLTSQPVVDENELQLLLTNIRGSETLAESEPAAVAEPKTEPQEDRPQPAASDSLFDLLKAIFDRTDKQNLKDLIENFTKKNSPGDEAVDKLMASITKEDLTSVYKDLKKLFDPADLSPMAPVMNEFVEKFNHKDLDGHLEELHKTEGGTHYHEFLLANSDSHLFGIPQVPEINYKNVYGDTPLHIACRDQNWRAIYTLVYVEGIKLAITDNQGKIPFQHLTPEFVAQSRECFVPVKDKDWAEMQQVYPNAIAEFKPKKLQHSLPPARQQTLPANDSSTESKPAKGPKRNSSLGRKFRTGAGAVTDAFFEAATSCGGLFSFGGHW